MFHTIRHIAKRVTPVLMVLFFAVLAADEYCDTVRALEDVRIESCMELEAYDFEWDDDDEPDGVEESAPLAGMTVIEARIVFGPNGNGIDSCGFIPFFSRKRKVESRKSKEKSRKSKEKR